MIQWILILLLFPAVSLAAWTWEGPFFDPPPLNTPNMWARQVGPVECPGCTGNILALVWDTKSQSQNSLYPWPLYVQLTTDQYEGDAVGVYSRLHQRQSSGWATAFHAEPFAEAGSNNTLIGLNVEPHNQTGEARVFGAVFNAKEGLNESAIHITGDGGQWRTGLALNGNSIDFGGGAVMRLDERGRLCVYRPNGRKARCLTGRL